MLEGSRESGLYAALSWGLCLAMLAHALAISIWRANNRARVGEVQFAVRRRRAVRLALVGGELALLALVALIPSGIPKSPALLALALATYSLWISPGFQDSWLGSRGVQRGFFARRYEDIEEWRLTGDHLRWKLFGTWTASDVPREQHQALREKLTKLCPERESRLG